MLILQEPCKNLVRILVERLISKLVEEVVFGEELTLKSTRLEVDAEAPLTGLPRDWVSASLSSFETKLEAAGFGLGGMTNSGILLGVTRKGLAPEKLPRDT